MAVCEAMRYTDMRVYVYRGMCVCVLRGGGEGLVGGQEKGFYT